MQTAKNSRPGPDIFLFEAVLHVHFISAFVFVRVHFTIILLRAEVGKAAIFFRSVSRNVRRVQIDEKIVYPASDRDAILRSPRAIPFQFRKIIKRKQKPR